MQIRLICIKGRCDSPVNTSPEIIEFLENAMALLVWVPELDTGIAEIDRQHRRIVDMADGEILSFGPRSAEVLDALARAIYAPDVP